MINKKAGFWIRFVARVIDVLIISFVSIGSAFLMMVKNPMWHFRESWMFYVWILSLINLLILFGILIPLVFKGKSIGQMICRIKIISNDKNFLRAFLKRELFYTWSWVFIAALVMVVINHTLISRYASTNQKDISYSIFESLRIAVVSSVGSILVFVQMIVSISGIVRKDKTSLNDIYAKTKTVWINKFEEIENNSKKSIDIKPKEVLNEHVEWIK